ncbi:MAG TPA: M1 family aminopeptidase [Pyrinomonadaceae bacterium]
MKHTVRQPSSRRRLAIGASLLLIACAVVAATHGAASAQTNANATAAGRATKPAERARYDIQLTLDFDQRAYTGSERVRWVNEDNRPTSVIYFHLYSNLRARSAATSSASPGVLSDEPRLEVTEVRAAATEIPLVFAFDDGATVLRVNLREPVAAGASVEVVLKFKGSVPEIDPEETGLVTHVLQQVGAVLRSEREARRARDMNFRCRGVMLLGTAYPVLASRDGEEWARKIEAGIGDKIFADTADYHVTIDAPADVQVFSSGAALERSATEARSEATARREFVGESLRDFAIVAGRNLRSAQQAVGDVKVQSVYMAEHEAVGRRVLAAAAGAVRVYIARFGKLPLKTVSIVDAPLVAGLGSAEFTGFGVIASAFYVDFDSPLMRNLPELVRDQRASLEDSLEFAVAHVTAHQWWGATVGNNPEREPVLDEALAQWSALLYYRETHGEARAATALNDQLRGVYKVYRTFGGEDMAADRAAREYRNFFQYSAIVASKGALMFTALRELMGDEKFFAALRSYYQANMLEVAEMDDLRGAFMAETPLAERRAVARTFNRWLSGKRGDEDISPPDPELALALGLNPNISKSNDGNAFARLGKFFWQQMTRIR